MIVFQVTHPQAPLTGWHLAMVAGRVAALDVAWLLHFLPPGGATGLIRIDKVAYGASESRLEDNAGQSEQRQLGIVPIGHAAYIDIRVAGELAKLKLLALGGALLRDAVDNQRGLVIVAQHLHLVPVAVVQFPAHSDDLGTAAQIVAQTQCALDQFQLEEVIGAAIVGVKHKAVGLLRLELQLQRAIQPGVPLAERVEGVLRSVQLKASADRDEAGHQADQQRRYDQHAIRSTILNHDGGSRQVLCARGAFALLAQSSSATRLVEQ